MSARSRPLGPETQPIPLPEPLDEFRTALEQEIEAARRDAANQAIVLSSGKFVATIGARLHYRFETQTAVRVPPDTPGDLILPDREERIEVTIVEVEELSVTVSVALNLGRAVPQARLQTDLTMLLRKLIARIEEKHGTSHPAADRVLGQLLPTGNPVKCDFSHLKDPPLNPEQVEAVENCLGCDTTFIWGPPGTGKTQTIGAIGDQLFRRGQSLLVVSHTNTAVDEALLRIAKNLSGIMPEGSVIRIGDPVKHELQTPEWEHVILRKLAEKRSAQLLAQKTSTENQRVRQLETLRAIEREIGIVEWASDGAADIEMFAREVEWLRKAELEHEHLQRQEADAQRNEPHWTNALNTAKKAAGIVDERFKAALHSDKLNSELSVSKAALAAMELELQVARNLEHRAASVEPYRKRRASLPPRHQLLSSLSFAQSALNNCANTASEAEAKLSSARAVLDQTCSVGTIKRIWMKLPKPEDQRRVIEELERVFLQLSENYEVAVRDAEECESRLREADTLDAGLAEFANVPDLSTQQATVARLEKRLRACEAEQQALESALDAATNLLRDCDERLAEFWHTYQRQPNAILAEAETFFKERKERRELQASLRRQHASRREALENQLRALLEVLVEWSLTESADGDTERMFALVSAAHRKASDSSRRHSLPALEQERNRLSAYVDQLDSELKAIELALTRVEQDIISGAKIIATTLTRAYLRDLIQARPFDTVLLDEASMAPIPALWASATLASRAIVVVGDFKQLPPIVQSEHPIALRWLGRDIFKASGIQDAWDRKRPPAHFKPLREQWRMHPAISDISNQLVYNGLLRDGAGVRSKDADAPLAGWFQPLTNQPDLPVVLLNTAECGGWNTTAARSRVNLLSAFLCIELASEILLDQRLQPKEGAPRRVLIICPYRPQAKLLQLLVREHGLQAEVAANTAHSFQGSEADVVILDLVVDSHFRANLLTAAADEDNMRLFNVAITRAKRRLFVIGNFDWFRQKGRNAFIGRDLIPLLTRTQDPWPANTMVLNGKSRLITDHYLIQRNGIHESNHERLIFAANNCFDNFLQDVDTAEKRIVIFAPILSWPEGDVLEVCLSTTGERRANAYLVTRPINEYPSALKGKAEALKQRLIQAGVAVIHKSGMLEKLAFIDDSTLWIGSALPSASNSTGFLERRHHRKLVSEIAELLRLDKLLEPFSSGTYRCPVCGKEMWASEASETNPFYWRCEERACYSRGLEEAPLKDGMITFPCGGTPKFDYWGEKAIWLCDCGNRHRKALAKVHLKLPKMLALIPKRSRPKLFREFGFPPDGPMRQAEFGI